jgi:hypothetical protein
MVDPLVLECELAEAKPAYLSHGQTHIRSVQLRIRLLRLPSNTTRGATSMTVSGLTDGVA